MNMLQKGGTEDRNRYFSGKKNKQKSSQKTELDPFNWFNSWMALVN